MAALQKIIRIGYERLQAAGAKLAPHACRAIERICRCRTAALGGHIQACPDGHIEKAWYNSCRESPCPECNFTSGTVAGQAESAASQLRLLSNHLHHSP
jgi:hypothetical protein